MIVDVQQSFMIAGLVGLLAGAHAAIWGMYKDAVHEGFGFGRFARSMILGAAAAALLQATLQLSLPHPAALVVLFGMAYAAERFMVEMWKTFVRQEDQSKYFIPMQFSVGGVPVTSRAVRLSVGAGCVLALAGCLAGIARLDNAGSALPHPIQAMLVGLAVGMIVAIGGCWKDAPTEGFDLFKFFRSPSVTVLCALALSWLTDSHAQIAVAALGFERAAVETYKTFLASKPPGKFYGKPILFPHMLQLRRYFVPAYAVICVFVVATTATALSERARNFASTAQLLGVVAPR